MNHNMLQVLQKQTNILKKNLGKSKENFKSLKVFCSASNISRGSEPGFSEISEFSFRICRWSTPGFWPAAGRKSFEIQGEITRISGGLETFFQGGA